MQRGAWWKVTLFVLILAFLFGLSGCQLVRGLENTADEFSAIPDRLERSIMNLLDGVKNIGGALAEQVRNIVGNMTGR